MDPAPPANDGGLWALKVTREKNVPPIADRRHVWPLVGERGDHRPLVRLFRDIIALLFTRQWRAFASGGGAEIDGRLPTGLNLDFLRTSRFLAVFHPRGLDGVGIGL